MPQITRITQQKDQNRANIYLDGKFAFGVTLESLLQHGLKVNQELNTELIQELKKEDSEAKVYNHALAYATLRPRSEKEIKLWFRRKKIEDPKLIEQVFNRLKKLNLVDDLAFAKWWVEQRTVFRPKPKRVLKQELRAKGVSDDIFESAFEETETIDDLEIAKKIAAKRWERVKKLPEKEAKQKLMQFLARRGFSYDTIRQAIDEIVKKE